MWPITEVVALIEKHLTRVMLVLSTRLGGSVKEGNNLVKIKVSKQIKAILVKKSESKTPLGEIYKDYRENRYKYSYGSAFPTKRASSRRTKGF